MGFLLNSYLETAGGGGIEFIGSGVASDQPGVGRTNTFSTDIFDDTGSSGVTILENDIVIVCMGKPHNADVADTALKPSGYTTELELYQADTTHTNLCVSWKVMGATPDTSLTIPGQVSSFDSSLATIHIFRGVDTTTPFDVASTTATAANNGQPNPPSITPSSAGSWIMCTGLAGETSMASGNAVTKPADLSSTTNHWIETQTLWETFDGTIGTGLKTDWTSGAFDCGVFGGGTTGSGASWCAAAMALRPA